MLLDLSPQENVPQINAMTTGQVAEEALHRLAKTFSVNESALRYQIWLILFRDRWALEMIEKKSPYLGTKLGSRKHEKFWGKTQPKFTPTSSPVCLQIGVSESGGCIGIDLLRKVALGILARCSHGCAAFSALVSRISCHASPCRKPIQTMAEFWQLMEEEVAGLQAADLTGRRGWLVHDVGSSALLFPECLALALEPPPHLLS